MKPSAEWEVTRVDGTVHVDLTQATEISEADTDAIIAATEEFLTHDEVTVVRLNGPVLMQEGPPDGLKHAMQCLDALARKHDKRLVVGQI